jgi:hypothetical protein
MPRDIPIDDLLAFLDRPITSVLATHGRDGRVRLSPVRRINARYEGRRARRGLHA